MVAAESTASLRLRRSLWRRAAQLLVWPLFAICIVGAAMTTQTDSARFTWVGLALNVVVWLVVLAIVPALLVATRGSFSQPRLVLAAGSLQVVDRCLLTRPLILERSEVRGVRPLDAAPLPHDELGIAFADLSPFREPMTLELQFTGPRRIAEARAGILGNWWWLLTQRADARLPRVPNPKSQYEMLRVRASDEVTDAVTAWLND